jgi:hypothetical protein
VTAGDIFWWNCRPQTVTNKAVLGVGISGPPRHSTTGANRAARAEGRFRRTGEVESGGAKVGILRAKVS